MSDSNDRLDELFRNRFEDVELPVSDKLLANIKKELEIPKRKRRLGLWIWIASAIAIVGGLAGSFIFSTGDNKNNEVTPVALITEGTEDSIRLGATSVNSKTENESSSVAEKSNVQQSRPDHTSGEPIKEEASALLQENYSIKKDIDESVVETNYKKKVTESSGNLTGRTKGKKYDNKEHNKENATIVNSTKESGNKKRDEVDQTKSELLSEQKSSKNSIQQENGNSDTKKTELNSEVAAESNRNNTKELKKEDNVTVESTAIGNALEVKQSAQSDSLVVMPDTAMIVDVKTSDSIKIVKKEESPKEIKAEKNFSFFIELNGGPSQSFRTKSFSDNYISDHSGMEKPYLTYNANIDVGILFKNKYQVTTGIGIDNKGEKYNFPGSLGEYHITSDTTDYYVEFDTIIDSVEYYDTIWTVITDTQYFGSVQAASVKNKYQYLRLPVMFGYRFNINEKLFITPNIGVIVNYLIAGNSTWFDEYRRQLISYNSRSYYRQIVFAARARIDLGFNVNEKWSILVQPGYTRFLQSIYRKEEVFRSYPYSYDLNVAIRYTFQ